MEIKSFPLHVELHIAALAYLLTVANGPASPMYAWPLCENIRNISWMCVLLLCCVHLSAVCWQNNYVNGIESFSTINWSWFSQLRLNYRVLYSSARGCANKSRPSERLYYRPRATETDPVITAYQTKYRPRSRRNDMHQWHLDCANAASPQHTQQLP